MATRNQLNPPPLRKITDFKSKLSGGGARSNLFEVVLSFPDAAPADTNVLDKSRFLVKTAALPGSTVTPLEVAFRGRTLKLAGDRTFESWTITVINDTDFAIRSAFEQPTETFKRLLKKTKMFKNRHSLGCSVTKWIDYFFTIWPYEHLAHSH